MNNHAIEYLPVKSLTAYARNSRVHSDDQIVMLADSIRRFGFNNPVLIDEDGTIIAGHGRVQAARLAGLEEVPCIRLAHLTEAERRAYVIADNRIAEHGRWDDALLHSELQELALDDDFTASELGFDDSAWDSMLGTADESLLGDGTSPGSHAQLGKAANDDGEPTADDHADRGAGMHNPGEGKGILYPVILQLNKAMFTRWKSWRGNRSDTEAIGTLLERLTESAQ